VLYNTILYSDPALISLAVSENGRLAAMMEFSSSVWMVYNPPQLKFTHFSVIVAVTYSHSVSKMSKSQNEFHWLVNGLKEACCVV